LNFLDLHGNLPNGYPIVAQQKAAAP
jgi:hypothetical protein